MKRKLILTGIIAALCTSMLAGCGKNNAKSTTADMPTGEITYPIETDQTIKYWVRLASALGSSVKNYAETPFAKKLMENTGIKIEYLHPAQGQETEVLNLLIASGDLPDIIESDWLSRNPDQAIEKRTILELNSLIENYSPNLKKYLSENPDVDTQIKTDTSKYYVYPFIRGHELLLSTAGFMMRTDWLEELGIAAPETIDEWDSALAALKTKCETPLAMGLSNLAYFCGAYNISNQMYIDNGTVKYGAAENAYLDYLKKMNEWYQKGYIDKNFAILDPKLIKANMLGGTSAASFGAGGGMLGLYLNTNAGQDYDLGAVPFPTLEKGVKPEFGNKQFKYSPLNGAAITAQSKVPELAARLLDYSYSEEGFMLNNFGIEGESYDMVGEYPTYKEVITKNPDGLAMSQALPLYVRAANEAPFVQDVRYIEQYYALKQQSDALAIWGNNNDEKHRMPQITLTNEESDEYTKIINDIETYRDEMATKFIMGEESFDNFGTYVETLKSMKIDRAVEIQQAAYDRFISR